MNYGCGNVNFTGKVDKSVYKFVKMARSDALQTESLNKYTKNYDSETIKKNKKVIKQQAKNILDLLEKKAALMLPDTVITLQSDAPTIRKFLCVKNDKYGHGVFIEPPCSISNPMKERDFASWQLCGTDAGSDFDPKYAGEFVINGKDQLRILEERVKDFDAKQTDSYLFQMAEDSVIDISKACPNADLLDTLNYMLSAQKALGIKSDFMEVVEKNSNVNTLAKCIELRKSETHEPFIRKIAALFL